MLVRAAQLIGVVAADRHGLFGHDPLVLAEDLTGGARLLGQHQIRVGAVGVGAGQLDHLGPQRRQQPRRLPAPGSICSGSAAMRSR